MIFGIKTKKAKKIEQLENEITRLGNLIMVNEAVEKRVLVQPVTKNILHATYRVRSNDMSRSYTESYIHSKLVHRLSQKLLSSGILNIDESVDTFTGDIEYSTQLEVIPK